MRPDAGAFFQVSNLSRRSTPGALILPFAVLAHAGFGQLGVEVASIRRFRSFLLLLLFQRRGIELAVRRRCSLVTGFRCLPFLRLLGLLLFRKALEEIGNFIDVFVA